MKIIPFINQLLSYFQMERSIRETTSSIALQVYILMTNG